MGAISMGDTLPSGLRYLGTERLMVAPQRPLEVAAVHHSRFLYALEVPVYLQAEGQDGRWAGRLEPRELTLIQPGERLAVGCETGGAAEVFLIQFAAEGGALKPAAAPSGMPARVRLPKVGLWLAEMERGGEGWPAEKRPERAVPADVESLAAFFRMQSHLYEVAAAYLCGARQWCDGKAALLSYAEQVRQEMVANCHKPFDIELVARQSGASPHRFYRAFRRLTGLSPHKYLTVLRLDRSLRLLAAGPGSVAEVAHAVGYDDELYFSRLFKRAMGTSPRAYMKAVQEHLEGVQAAAGDLAVFGVRASSSGSVTRTGLEDLNWRQRLYWLGELLGLEGVASHWFSLLDLKLENAASLVHRCFGRMPFLVVGVERAGWQVYGAQDAGVGDLFYRAVGLTAPEAVRSLDCRLCATLAEVAALECGQVLFLAPGGTDRSRVEADWLGRSQGLPGARCLFLDWEGNDDALSYERLVEQLTRLLLTQSV